MNWQHCTFIFGINFSEGKAFNIVKVFKDWTIGLYLTVLNYQDVHVGIVWLFQIKYDFVDFIRMFLVFMISGGVTIQAILYPNYPLGIDLIKRVLTRPLFAMFLTQIADLDGKGSNPVSLIVCRYYFQCLNGIFIWRYFIDVLNLFFPLAAMLLILIFIHHAKSCGGYNVFDPSVSQSVSPVFLVSATPLKPLNRILLNFVVMRDIMCRCPYPQEIFIQFLNLEIWPKWKMPLKQFVSATPLKPLNRISWNFVVMKDI